jgi:hypothetical protein
MNENQKIVAFFLFCVLAQPCHDAHARKHPKRNAITLINVLIGWICPVTLPCLIWACWRLAENPNVLTPREEDNDFRPSID